MSKRDIIVLDAVRTTITTMGFSPTLDEIASDTGFSKTSVFKALSRLVHDGKLHRRAARTRGLELVDAPDLTFVGTDRLRGELARRGLTLDALAKPEPLRFEGRRCAATCCASTVVMGHLFCRPHWYSLPSELRDSIVRAFYAKDTERYQALVAEAIDSVDKFAGVTFAAPVPA